METNTNPKRHRGDNDHGTRTDPVIRYYNCILCKEGFSSSQALGGHMNLHRRDREKIQQQPSLYPSDSNSFCSPSYRYRPSSLTSCVRRLPSITLMPRDQLEKESASAWTSSADPSKYSIPSDELYQLRCDISARDVISSSYSSSSKSRMPPSTSLMEERMIPDENGISVGMHTYGSAMALPLFMPLQQSCAPTESQMKEMWHVAGVSTAAGEELDLELRLGPNPHFYR